MIPTQPAVAASRRSGRDHFTPPLALYVHFPWCVKKCPYCDFNSHPQRGVIDQEGYVDALLRDLEHDIAAHACAGRPLVSIFMGGGTPSLFGGAAMSRLLGEIRARLAFDEGVEITLEANPGGVEHDDFAAYRAAGINRLSLGAQSFNDACLAQLGRIHTGAEIRRAIRAARVAGFDNLNLDLMYGLPGQTPRSALADLTAALEFSPEHLSLYQLTIEPNTLFHRHPPALPDHDHSMDIQQALHDLAGAHGYGRYEVSAHAQAGRQCRHNLNYWQFGDYLGIGAGAHGKITRRGKIHRYWKPRHPQRYLASAGGGQGVETREITDRDLPFEFLMNALRLTDGFDTGLIPARTGLGLSEVAGVLDDAVNRGLVMRDGRGIRCSEKGYRFLDDVLEGVLAGSVASLKS